MPNERRDEARATVSIEVRWQTKSGEKRYARITNLGGGGCFIETTEQVEVGEAIGLEVRMPLGYWSPLRGEVIYHQPGAGFGVGFTHLTKADRTLVAQLIINASVRKL